MTAIVVALPAASAAIADGLELEGLQVSVVAPADLPRVPLTGVTAVLVEPSRATLTAGLVSACDRAGARLIPIGTGDSRLVARFGLPSPLPADAPAWRILEAIESGSASAGAPSPSSRVVAVWGPHGAPGRSTVAVQLAVELARTGRRAGLVDADTVAPSIALQLGLGDDSPGLAAACRRAELGSLDVAELARLSTQVETSAGPLDVLVGLNRPARWPEIAPRRLRSTLSTCRDWLEETVVDIAADLEQDDDPLDPGAPARHAATAATLLEADAVVAVLSADPLGVSRFLRGYAELRRLVGDSRVLVVANRVRPGPLGIDARGQVRRTLERFAGIDDVAFLPEDQRAVDGAAMHARAVADVAPRSPLVSAVRRVAAALGARTEVTAGNWRGSSRGARRPR